MAIPLRHASPSQATAGARTFFVTSSISNKRNLLQSDRSAGLFVRALYNYRAQRKFRLHEFVVMPDHFHALVTVECDITIERAIQFIKGGFAFRAGREFGFKAPVWQKGFSEARILDADAFCGPANIFGIIRSFGIWRMRQKSFLILPLILDSSLMWRRRGSSPSP